MRIILFLAIMVSVLFNITTNLANAEEVKKNHKNLTNVINKFIPSNSTLISPKQPASTKPFQFYDFNHDGNDEVIVNYKLKAKELPSQYGVIVLKKANDGWKNIWETKSQGVGLDYSGLVDVTGDGTKEYLFGVTIGASAGNHLEIFKWTNNSLRIIANVPYHMMELISNNKNEVGIAVWQRFIADTYFVNVLKWNGQRLTYDEKFYSKYYPVIEKFYDNKISKMNAWFYWYTLADAQIKANLFDKAEKSIQEGNSLAEQSSLDFGIEKFNQLKIKLENKKKSFSTNACVCG
jgi:hypothetical protein